MTQQDISTAKPQNVENIDNEKKSFSNNITRLSALACSFSHREDTDIMKAEKESQNGLKVLGTNGGLQEMLAAQMLSIHHLQQISMAMANKTLSSNNGQFFVNAAIKLANTFAQQANLLNKLQGNGGQKITIERVDVHHGGQAIVGNISGGTHHSDKVKK